MRTLTLAAALLLTTWPLTSYAVTADAASPQSARVTSLCHGLPVTIAGTPGSDVLVGTDGPDVIRGYDGFDQIDGGGGDDVICGNRGPDHIDGGEGDDWVGGGHKYDTVTGGPGNDVVRGGLTGDVIRADEGDDRIVVQVVDTLDYSASPGAIDADLTAGTVSGWGSDTVTLPSTATGTGNVHLVGTAYADHLRGGPGNDTIQAGDGDDVVDGADGNDQMWLGPGANTAVGGPGDDRIWFESCPDTGNEGRGGEGDDRIGSTGPHDRLYGGPGDDSVEAVSRLTGDLVVDGGGGNDTLSLGLGPRDDGAAWHDVRLDLPTGRLGAQGQHDTIGDWSSITLTEWDGPGAADGYELVGTAGPDRVQMNVTERVLVHAYDGSDWLATGSGDDDVFGGDGTDHVDAGSGHDVCSSVEEPYTEGGSTDCEVSSP